jgi:hypothetical protein
MSSDALYQIFSSWSILLFHTISFHSSYKIHQLFTDYLLRLPSSELLEKHLFRSRANRRLVGLPLTFLGAKNLILENVAQTNAGEVHLPSPPPGVQHLAEGEPRTAWQFKDWSSVLFTFRRISFPSTRQLARLSGFFLQFNLFVAQVVIQSSQLHMLNPHTHPSGFPLTWHVC